MAAGLEPAAAEELRRLGLVPESPERGVVRFRATLAEGARAALALRSAPRVVQELASGLTSDATGLADALREIPWEEHLPARGTWAARAVGVSDTLRHTAFTARLVKDAVVDRFRARGRAVPPVDARAPGALVEVRLARGWATVGLDLGGRSLHERGTGRHGTAPLREDVAAGIALLAGVVAHEPLLDPFCGTGTLIAEAAAVALGRPPGRDPEHMAFARLPLFRGVDARRIADELRHAPVPAHPPYLAFDADAAAVREARSVIARLGLAGHVTVEHATVPDVPLPALGPGLLLSNPPWGLRLELDDAERAWSCLGRLAHGRLAGWRLALVSGNPGITRRLGLRAERRFPVLIGGVDARLLLYRVHA